MAICNTWTTINVILTVKRPVDELCPEVAEHYSAEEAEIGSQETSYSIVQITKKTAGLLVCAQLLVGYYLIVAAFFAKREKTAGMLATTAGLLQIPFWPMLCNE